LTEGIPAYLIQKTLGGSKNIPLTAEGSSVVCKAISRTSVEKFSFFLQCTSPNKNSAKSDLAVREEYQETRKPRKRQKTNEMCGWA
jgi:hypothetical protein